MKSPNLDFDHFGVGQLSIPVFLLTSLSLLSLSLRGCYCWRSQMEGPGPGRECCRGTLRWKGYSVSLVSP